MCTLSKPSGQKVLNTNYVKWMVVKTSKYGSLKQVSFVKKIIHLSLSFMPRGYIIGPRPDKKVFYFLIVNYCFATYDQISTNLGSFYKC